MTETPRDPHPPKQQRPLNLIEITEEHLGKNRTPLGRSEVTCSIPEGTTPEEARLSRYESIAEQAPAGTRYFIAGTSTPSRFPGEFTGVTREPMQFTFTAAYYG